MEQIRHIRDILGRLNFSPDCEVRASELKEIQWYVVYYYYNHGLALTPALDFYREALNSIRDDLESKGNSAGIAVVDAALEALKALSDLVEGETPDSTSDLSGYRCFESRFGTFPNYFHSIDDLHEKFPKLFREFKNAVEKMFPYIEDLDTQGYSTVREPTLVMSLRAVFLGLIEENYRGEEGNHNNWPNCCLRIFGRTVNILGLYILDKYFHDIVNNNTFIECLSEILQELTTLEKAVGRRMFPNGQGARIRDALHDILDSLDSLFEKFRNLRIAYDQAVVDIGENGALFGPRFDELNRMLDKVNKGLSDLRYRIDRLEKILCPSFLGFGFYEFLCIVFIGSLAIFLYLGEEDTTAARSWNTGVYLLAVVGGIAYQAWRLATRYRDDGVVEMLREEWTAAGCIVPMAAALLHGGVIRSSVYSMTVVGIVAAAVCVQGLASRKMPRRQMCMVAGGILGLGALCAAGDRKMLLDSYEWRRWMCAGVVVFAALALLMLYADVPGDEEKTAKGAGEIVFLMSMAVLTGVSLVCGRDYCMVYGGGVPRKFLQTK
ncbi:hypothetical protein M970_110190 [Encephalitozoon cuniculi EcunIII-L]|nr:hypothetical protein M970_110190 [Encephalitozoon cuniculi EcunIII-L]